MKTITHDLQQGSDEWLSFRFQHGGASEIAAIMGLSNNMTRAELLRIKHTGIGKEFSDYVQKMILDKGHEVEALARPIVEKIIGSELYPVTMSKGRMSASCDGLTIADDEGWENKQYNSEYFAMVQAGVVPEEHMPQVQQCLLVTGADRWFFTISDGTEDRTAGVWVYPDSDYQERIDATWEQFYIDLANYTPTEIIERPQAEAIMELPAIFVQARGEITASNMQEYGTALTSRLQEVRSIALVTDQDFSNAKAAAKHFREQIVKLKMVKEAMLSQTTTIGEAARMMDAWSEDMRVTALQLEKDVEREDKAKKEAMVLGARTEWVAHIEALESDIKPIKMAIGQPDFAGSLKNKRTYVSMQNSVDTELSNWKVKATASAKDIREKLDWCKENADGYGFLFSDLQSIVGKAMDDFQLVITTRVESHKKAEAEKLEKERERIRLEEEAKAQRELADKEKRIAEEAAKVERERIAEEQAEANRNAKANTSDFGFKWNIENQEELERETFKNEASIDAPAAEVLPEQLQPVSNERNGTVELVHDNQVPMVDPVEGKGFLSRSHNAQSVIDQKHSATERNLPERGEFVWAISEYFDVPCSVAEQWLINEFSKSQMKEVA
jgi:predicted phage-related endonuclease